MNPRELTETTTGGTYRDGHVILDRPMNWEEGTRVVVQILDEEGGMTEGVWPADGSPSGEAEILRRMAANADDVPTPEEAADFEAALRAVEQFNRECLSIQRNPES